MKRDCYFYFEEHMMEGSIPGCVYDSYPMGFCPCDKCEHYISQKEVYNLVKNYEKERKEKTTE